MNTEKQLQELDARVSWNRNHLRIVFIMSALTMLATIGHFILHATGRV